MKQIVIAGIVIIACLFGYTLYHLYTIFLGGGGASFLPDGLLRAIGRPLIDFHYGGLYRGRFKQYYENLGIDREAADYQTLKRVTFDGRDGSTLRFSAGTGELVLVSVLDHDIIRVRYLPEGESRFDRTWSIVGKDGTVPREGRDREDLSPFPLPDFAVDQNDGLVRVTTKKMAAAVTLSPFRIEWSDIAGNMLARDLPEGAYGKGEKSRRVIHAMKNSTDDHYYGFGEKGGLLNRQGRRLVMADIDVCGYNARKQDPLYKNIPFYITLDKGGSAYGLFYDNLAIAEFDMGRADKARRHFMAEDGDIDFYFIYGPEIERVVTRFSDLTGKSYLPPRYSLGYLGSTMTYTESDNAQEELKRFVRLCEEHDIPCDLFHLSSGYTTMDDNKRYVFNWNRKKIPDPAAMVKNFHEAGMRLTANIKPALLTTHPLYGEVASFGGFITDPGSDKPHVTPFWGGEASYLDFTDKNTWLWWKGNIEKQLIAYGIDSMWNDNPEYEIWNDRCRADGFGRGVEISHVRPVMTNLMSMASMEQLTESFPGKRPFNICRSGGPGIQRYAQVWSGDNYTGWQALKYNIPMGLGLSLSGVPNTGHDVGGFQGFRPSEELFVRWVQHGVFMPRFTIHSWHFDESVNEPWMFPGSVDVIRDAIKFRYRLVPYLYSLLVDAVRTGRPIMRPMVYAFQDDPKCREESFDYMLGEKLLVASILKNGQRKRGVYLPGSGEWIDFHTGERYEPGQTVTVPAPIEYIPVLVQAGGIIPTGGEMKYIGEKPESVRRIFLFPHSGTGTGEFTLVEDDGVSLDYRRGIVTDVIISMESGSDRIDVSVSKTGMYRLPYDRMEFILPKGERREISYNGKVVSTELSSTGQRSFTGSI